MACSSCGKKQTTTKQEKPKVEIVKNTIKPKNITFTKNR